MSIFFCSDAPNVTQISVGTVQVVWHDIVTNYECANDFVVKYCQIEEDICNVTKPVNKTYVDVSDIKADSMISFTSSNDHCLASHGVSVPANSHGNLLVNP